MMFDSSLKHIISSHSNYLNLLSHENFKTNILSKQYRNAFKLINRDLVDFVATDAHDDVVRTPDMRNAMEIIVRKCGDGMTLNKIIL